MLGHRVAENGNIGGFAWEPLGLPGLPRRHARAACHALRGRHVRLRNFGWQLATTAVHLRRGATRLVSLHQPSSSLADKAVHESVLKLEARCTHTVECEFGLTRALTHPNGSIRQNCFFLVSEPVRSHYYPPCSRPKKGRGEERMLSGIGRPLALATVITAAV